MQIICISNLSYVSKVKFQLRAFTGYFATPSTNDALTWNPHYAYSFPKNVLSRISLNYLSNIPWLGFFKACKRARIVGNFVFNFGVATNYKSLYCTIYLPDMLKLKLFEISVF